MIKLVNIILSLLCIIFIFIIFYSKKNRENFKTTSTNIKCSGQLTTATQLNELFIKNYSFCADPLTYTFKNIKEVLEVDEKILHEIIKIDAEETASALATAADKVKEEAYKVKVAADAAVAAAADAATDKVVVAAAVAQKAADAAAKAADAAAKAAEGTADKVAAAADAVKVAADAAAKAAVTAAKAADAAAKAADAAAKAKTAEDKAKTSADATKAAKDAAVELANLAKIAAELAKIAAELAKIAAELAKIAKKNIYKKNILSSLTPEILKNQSDTNYFYKIDNNTNTTIEIKYKEPKKTVFTIAFRIIPIDDITTNTLILKVGTTSDININSTVLDKKNIYNIFIKIYKDTTYKYTTYVDGDVEPPYKDKDTTITDFNNITFKSTNSKKYYIGDIMFVNEDIDVRTLMYDYKNPRENTRTYYNTCTGFTPFLKYDSDRNFYSYDECVNKCSENCDYTKQCQEICMDCNKFIWDDSKRKEHCPWLGDNKIGKILKSEIRAIGKNKQISINWFRPDSPKKITDYILVISEASGSSGDRIHKIKDNDKSNQQVYLVKNLINNINYRITLRAVVIENNSIIMSGQPSDSLTVGTVGNEEEDSSYIYDEDYSHLDEDLSCTSNLENHILDTYKPKEIDIEYSIKKFINNAREKSGYILQ